MMYGSCTESLKIAILLLCSVPLVYGQTVEGKEGKPVTLPCYYTVKQSSDLTSMCWGRGSCPNSKCNDFLIKTDGRRVTYRSSNRYQLSGRITQGQVSLTIPQARLEDAGTYCCRIEHSGWFNDDKFNIQLKIAKAITTPPPISTTTPRPPPAKITTPRPPPAKITTTTPPSARTTTPLPPPAVTTTPQPRPAMTTTLPPQPAMTTTLPPQPAMTTTLPPQPAMTTTLPPQPAMTTTLPPQPVETTTPSPPPATTTTLPPQPVETTTPSPPPATTTIQPSINTYTADNITESELSTEFTTDVTTHDTRSTDSHFECDTERGQLPGLITEEHELETTTPEQTASDSSNNEMSDLFQGNITTKVKKESRIPLHILITAICASVIAVVLISLLFLKLREKERGQHSFGLEPNLELVTNAEEPLTEIDLETMETNQAKEDNVEASKTEDTSINTTKD